MPGTSVGQVPGPPSDGGLFIFERAKSTDVSSWPVATNRDAAKLWSLMEA
jgi:hypothetical protein